MKRFAVAMAALLAGCATEDADVAGRGVITETTNGSAARGRLVSSDSVPLVSGEVRVVLADDVPEAWSGRVRAMDTISRDGGFRLAGLASHDYELYAVARDSLGREVLGKSSFRLTPRDSVLDLVEVVAGRSARISGTYASYDSLVPVLERGWRVRAAVRGLGQWVFLDSVGGWSFEGVAAGTYRVRIQKLDGVPGNETTLEEYDVQAR